MLNSEKTTREKDTVPSDSCMRETEAGQLTHWNEPDPRPGSYRISLKTPLVNLYKFMSTYAIVSEYI